MTRTHYLSQIALAAACALNVYFAIAGTTQALSWAVAVFTALVFLKRWE